MAGTQTHGSVGLGPAAQPVHILRADSAFSAFSLVTCTGPGTRDHLLNDHQAQTLVCTPRAPSCLEMPVQVGKRAGAWSYVT